MKVWIGLDIGGTKLLVASTNQEGEILQRVQELTPLDFDKGINTLHRMIAKVSDKFEVAGIGAAIGGPLDWKQGVVSPLHQPQWRDVPFKSIMEEHWDCPFAVDVDTNVAALGEYRFGTAQAPRLLYITVSTGMGGGFLIDGQLYRGAGGCHPEVGHQSIPYRCSHPERISCACGAPDCLEALVSGNGIRRIYKKPAEELNTQEWDEVAYNLGQGLRNLATIYLPDVIIIGGGIATGRGDALIDSAYNIMEAHLKLVPTPQVYISTLGYDTALYGAIALALETDKAC